MIRGAVQRETMSYDVVIVGAGPSGLAAAVRLKQIAQQHRRAMSVCVLEKGAEVGAHILSGAVMDPRALDELIPDWRERDAPAAATVAEEYFMLLSERRAWRIPHYLLPPAMHNRDNLIVSLGDLCRWLGARAEELGVEIYSGFPAVDILYDDADKVCGVLTGDFGIDRNGTRTERFSAGAEIRATYTLFAEGCRGSLGKKLIERFRLAAATPQTYGIGIKELWELAPDRHRPGTVLHSVGWPLGQSAYGGSFMYHMHGSLAAVGIVIGLDYRNPWLDPFAEMQRFKTHPAIRGTFEGGRRIGYGARALNEGGLQSLPRMVFPGGLLIGCEAGTLNAARIKGIHTAMKTGMLAAETVFEALQHGADPAAPLTRFHDSFQSSWAWRELHRARNVRPGFKRGLVTGMLMAGLDQTILRGRAPWTLRHELPDHAMLVDAHQWQPIAYPKPDGRLTFDRMSSVYLANVNHEEDQPCHLVLRDSTVPMTTNYPRYQAPEQRYCPAGVYEIVDIETAPRLQINAVNCIHCKTCDIKDPAQNIEWTAPEGGGGPNYVKM